MQRFWFEDTAWEPEAGVVLAGMDAGPGAVRTTRDGISLEQILHDRPDVFRAFFTEYYGPGNDPHSTAWLKRVGGATPEDYANYWYEQHGRWEGYAPRTASAAPDEDAVVRLPGIAETGRTTADGISLSQILHDRPDVFRAFFTEYYGPNNDRKSDAWNDRVGGATPEDYANYWYETYGRWEGYVPGAARAPVEPPGEPSEPVFEFEPPEESDQPPPEDVESAPAPIEWPWALPLVVQWRDDGGFDLVHAPPPAEIEVGGVLLSGQALSDFIAEMF